MSGQMAELTGRLTAAVDEMRLHLRTILGESARQPAADAEEPFAAEADVEEIDTGVIDTDDGDAPHAPTPIYTTAAESPYPSAVDTPPIRMPGPVHHAARHPRP